MIESILKNNLKKFVLYLLRFIPLQRSKELARVFNFQQAKSSLLSY